MRVYLNLSILIKFMKKLKFKINWLILDINYLISNLYIIK